MTSPLCTLSKLSDILGSGQELGSVLIESVSIDSRQCKAGTLFFALPGRYTDGHHYLQQAVEAGALALVVSSERKEAWKGLDSTIIAVPDPLLALQKLAAWQRQQCVNTTVVAITGSNGKTTTKELAGSVLSAAAPCYVSPGNFNSEIGVALALCEMRTEHSYAVFEAGIDHVGEMDVIERMLKPDMAILTNIGHAHIGEFGTQEVIVQEKRKLFLQAACCIIPDDRTDAFLEGEGNAITGEIIRYDVKDREAVEYKGLGGMYLRTELGRFYLPMVGEHYAHNALAVLALAKKLNIEVSAIQRGMDSVQLIAGRGNIHYGAITLIGDWYNASPESIHAALQVLDTIAKERSASRKIIVLGGVKELGTYSEELHQVIYEEVCSHYPDLLFLYGEEFAALSLCSSEHHFCVNKEELIQKVQNCLRAGDCVLIKGSRAYALEELQEQLNITQGGYMYAP